jgi:hypothetical protein
LHFNNKINIAHSRIRQGACTTLGESVMASIIKRLLTVKADHFYCWRYTAYPFSHANPRDMTIIFMN